MGMMITIFLFFHSVNFFTPFMCSTALFIPPRLWPHQDSFSRALAKPAAPVAKPAAPLALHQPRTAWAWLHSTKSKEKLNLLKNTPDKPILPLLLCCFSVRADACFGLKHSCAKGCVQTDPARNSRDGRSNTGLTKQHCCC